MAITHRLTASGIAKTTRSEIIEQVEQPETSLLFQQAVTDGWNLEYDWLWLATKLNSDERRIYCYQQALQINPHSAPARQGLKALRRKRTK